MALVHRALFTWFILLVFLIFIVLRMDSRIQWNWFVIFTPFWIYNTFLIMYTVFNIASYCKMNYIFRREMIYLFHIIMLVAFQIMAALKLDAFINISSFYMMAPLWFILTSSAVIVFCTLIGKPIRFFR